LYILGAILLLSPASATAGPIIPGEPVGTHVFCGKAVTIGSKLASAQPLRVHGICQEILSISDTRVNITIIGDGGDVRDAAITGSACSANEGATTIFPDDPSAAEIIQVRGKNITITALNVFGLRADDPSIKPPVGPLGLPAWDTAQCTGAQGKASTTLRNTDANNGDPLLVDAQDPFCSNNRGIRAQRNGIMLIGRNTRLDAVKGGDDPTDYYEKSGVCIKNVGSAGIEVTQGSFARVINSEVQHVGGDGVLISEGSAAFIGSASGSEYKLDQDAFRGPGHSGPNYIHNNTGAGVNVDRGSEARIVNNFIAFNGKAGVAVGGASNADVDSNIFAGNLGSGLSLAGNSNVALGSTYDTLGCNETTWGAPCGVPGTFDPRTLANTVTVVNISFGIKCVVGASITGRSSTDRAGGIKGLAGNGAAPTSTIGGGISGISSFDANCINKAT
jgi:hypothetical protein